MGKTPRKQAAKPSAGQQTLFAFDNKPKGKESSQSQESKDVSKKRKHPEPPDQSLEPVLKKSKEETKIDPSKQPEPVCLKDASRAPYKDETTLRELSSPQFDPVKDAPHHAGQKLPFSFVARALSDIEQCSGKDSKDAIKEIIANVFRAAIAQNSSELVELYYFFIVKLAPEYEGMETGVGHEIVLKAVAKACGKSDQQIREQF